MFVRFVAVQDPDSSREDVAESEIILEMSAEEAEEFVQTANLDEEELAEYGKLREAALDFRSKNQLNKITLEEDHRANIGFLMPELGNTYTPVSMDLPDFHDGILRWRQIPAVTIESFEEIPKYMSLWYDWAADCSVEIGERTWSFYPVPNVPLEDYFSTYEVMASFGLEHSGFRSLHRQVNQLSDQELYFANLVSKLPVGLKVGLSDFMPNLAAVLTGSSGEWINRAYAAEADGESILRFTQQEIFWRNQRALSAMKWIEQTSQTDESVSENLKQIGAEELFDIVGIAAVTGWRYFYPSAFALSEFFNDLNMNYPRLTNREERLAINAVELSRDLIDRGINEDWDMSKVEDEIMANLACSRSIALQIIESLTTQAEDF
jgi:hypothetical protein